ncbi:MAG: hypothetical protein LBG13_00555 [Holosporales bacterium]|jgi:hypothetical protein|nr:hypothetical protein [Holosporales bacterium]
MEFKTKKKSGRTWITTPDGSDPVFEKTKVDNTILKALVKAHLWQRELDSGKFTSIRELASKKNINESYIRRVLNLNYLPPKTKVAILEGGLSREVRLVDSVEVGLRMRW